MKFLLGRKIGMTRVFDENGKVVPVTVIEVTPSVVAQVKTVVKDGYTAVQVGYGKAKHPNKPAVGHAAALSAAPRYLREFRTEEVGEATVGTELTAANFEVGDLLRLTATSKGKGFAGVIKRHNFHRGPETHGSDHHRAPGSIGSMFPQHVLRGQKMPGRMGNDQVTIRKVKVVDIDVERNLLLVKGPVPGMPGTLVEISEM